MKDFFGDVEIVKNSIKAIKEASIQMADIDQSVNHIKYNIIIYFNCYVINI
jgi:hypothetical protein